MTAQSANKPGRFLADHNNREKNAIVISGMLAFLSFIYSIYGFFFPLNPEVNYALPTFISAIAFSIACFLNLKKKVVWGITICLLAVYGVSGFFILTTEAIAPNLALAFVLIGSGIGIFTLESTQRRNVLIGVFLGGGAMIFAAPFFALQQYPASPLMLTLINLVSLILVIAYIAIALWQFPSYSLNGKIVVSLVSVILVALIVVSIVFTVVISFALTNQIGANLRTLAENEAISVGEVLSSNVDTLETLATNGLLISETQFQANAYNNLDEDGIQEQIAEYDLIWTRSDDSAPIVDGVLDTRLVDELKKIQVIFPDITDLIVADKYGALVAATSRPFDYYQGDESWWQDAYLNGFGAVAIGLPYYDAERDSWLLEISVPIHGVDGGGQAQVVGVVQAAIRMNALGRVLETARFGTTGEVEVLMPDGRIMHTENNELEIELANPSEENLVVNLEEIYTRSSVNDVPSLLSSSIVRSLSENRVIEDLNWTVVVHQAEREGLALVSNLRVAAGILIVIIVFITGAVASLIGNRLSQPIIDLTAVAEKVAEGDLSAHAEVSSINEQDEIGTLTHVFNGMTVRLQDAISNLEFRVAERTRAIATSSDVGRRLSTILDREQLVDEVVTQVQDAFKYYHVHIYLFDKSNQTLRMAGGTGQAGKQMLASKHQIAVGQGLVGRAAAMNTPVLVSDVNQEEGWLPNPLLPETKAETAVPISIGERVLGVLDVQQNKVNGLTQDDVELLVSITNQIAIALQNAEFLETTQEQANQEALSNEINLKIQSANSIEQAMQIAVRELGRALDAPKTRIKLTSNESKTTHSGNGNSN